MRLRTKKLQPMTVLLVAARGRCGRCAGSSRWGGADPAAEASELAVDASVTPAGVLGGQADDQGAHASGGCCLQAVAQARGQPLLVLDHEHPHPLILEVRVSPGGGDAEGVRTERFVVCHNPEAADRDATVRERLLAHLGELIDGSDTWTARRRDELVGTLKAKPGLRRYLRRTPSGLLRIDRGAATREAHLDGKWLLRTSDETLTGDDIADAYKQLVHIERGWRDLKGALELRPVFHHREDRIRAHIQLCWLALLLIRVIENTAADTWRNIRHELDRMALVTLATDDGQVAQRSITTTGQRAILTALELPEPPRFFDFTPDQRRQRHGKPPRHL